MLLRHMGAGSRKALTALVFASLAFLAGLCGSDEARAFSDVSSAHPFRTQIEVVRQLGVVSGFNDGNFRPDASLTRQQFAKMLVLAMRIPVSEDDSCPFSDVQRSGPDSLYPDNHIGALVREGIVVGVKSSGGSGQFRPGEPLTLAQLITMCTRAAKRPLVEPPVTYRPTWGNFGPPHFANARVAQYNGLLRELPLSTMNPWHAATRAEAAAILFNLMGTDPEAICGRFLGTSADLVKYFRTRVKSGEKFTVPVEELAQLYDKYCRRFGIRADLAWVQMCHETGFGLYGYWSGGTWISGDVKPEQNNFAGIGATGNGAPGNVFATAELGVIAHIVHLAWYVYPDHFADAEDPKDSYCRKVDVPEPDVTITTPGDPRHFPQNGRPHRADARTVLDLSGKWAVGQNYGATLKSMMAQVPVTVGW